jgi:hypothetical protein
MTSTIAISSLVKVENEIGWRNWLVLYRASLQMFKMVPYHFVWILFLLLKKSIWFEGIRDKNHHADAAQDDGAQRALVFIKY